MCNIHFPLNIPSDAINISTLQIKPPRGPEPKNDLPKVVVLRSGRARFEPRFLTDKMYIIIFSYNLWETKCV